MLKRRLPSRCSRPRPTEVTYKADYLSVSKREGPLTV